MFNGDIKVSPCAVVCPLDAQDISRYVHNSQIAACVSDSTYSLRSVILFCRKHSFSASIKAGGYGTAGWAVGGDIVIDLCNINDIDLEPPAADGSFTSIKDMPLVGNKGKVRAGPPLPDMLDGPSSAKRRRDEDDELRSYDLASEVVADFLHPGGISTPFADRHPPTRRRMDFSTPMSNIPQTSIHPVMSSSSFNPNTSVLMSLSSSSSNVSGPSLPSSHTPAAMTVAPPSSAPEISPPSVSSLGDPFSYLDDVASSPAPPVASTSRLAQSMPNSLFATPSFLESPTNILTYATPIYSHAFMTFGAGKRQKEIDQFSAANPLRAVSLSGGRGAVPYHIPS